MIKECPNTIIMRKVRAAINSNPGEAWLGGVGSICIDKNFANVVRVNLDLCLFFSPENEILRSLSGSETFSANVQAQMSGAQVQAAQDNSPVISPLPDATV